MWDIELLKQLTRVADPIFEIFVNKSRELFLELPKIDKVIEKNVNIWHEA